LLALAVGGFVCSTASAAVEVLGVQYQQDDWFTEFNCIWKDSNYPTTCTVGTAVGCNVHAYLKNTGGSSVTVTSVQLEGYDLETVIKENADQHNARSIFYYWDNPPTAILDAGEPVWYKVDPSTTIPAGGVVQVVIRLRFVPETNPLDLTIVTSGGTVYPSISISASDPVLASVGFSQDRKKVYLTWRRSGGAAPTTIKMDGTDVTSYATTVGDSSTNYAVSVLSFSTALTNMSYHVYQGIYSDGKKATASLRTWVNKFMHGTYNTFELDAQYTVADWVAESADHGINNTQVSVGNIVSYMNTPSGAADLLARNYGYTTGDHTKFDEDGYGPDMFFINDEIDAEEANLESNFCGTGLKLPCGKSPMGVLARRTIDEGEVLRDYRENTPTSVNMNGAFKPENYYSYGQAVDILQVDPYYQRRLQDVYWRDQNAIPVYEKATYIYAVAKAVARAAEPNPSNVILYSCSWKCTAEGKCDAEYVGEIWPFADNGTKRIEAYYALAAGTKGLCYWWFNIGWPSMGLANQTTQEAQDLWKEMGLYGNEIKALAPQLVVSHPVDAGLTPSTNVWAKALVSGTDSLILIVVNDDYWNDETLHYNPVNSASVVVTLPSWLQSSPTAFEVTPDGICDVGTSLSGSALTVNLGKLDLTRMIVITSNSSLKGTVEDRYLDECRPGICNFASERCTAQNTTAEIVLQPGSMTMPADSTINFAILAAGTGPFTYQWQKNSVNLSNGNGISGVTTPALMIAGLESGDAGNYRCVVTNSYGSVNSNAATLTVSAGPCGTMTNASFEGGNTNGVATGWTGYQRATNPTTTWTIQTGSPPAGAGAQYQQIVNTSATGGGGVRQNVGDTIADVEYTISGWMRTNSGSATATVKCSPTASTNWATAVNLSPAQTTTSSTWVAFSGTVTATGTSMTIWLDGHTGGTGLNKAVCFDDIQVTCWPPEGPTITQQPSAQNICSGATATFSVSATGSGTLTYQWQKNQANLSNGGHYSGCTTTTLTVSTADSNDVANYRCVVTDSGGSANSDEAALSLKAATSITAHPSAQNVCAGATATFTVAATGDGTLSYQWQKNSANISNGGHYSGCTTATLTVSSADGNDVANYRCVVTGGCGSANSSQAALSLKAATTITSHPSNQSVSSGGTANFSVTATGDGTLTYQWQKNQSNLSNGGHYSGCTTATLTISTADSNDEANYRCVVTGGCGSANSNEASLTVTSGSCSTPSLLNASFEGGNTNGVGTSWTGYQRATNPTTVWTIQTASPPTGGGTQYQQIANTSATGGGGVRQNITNCTSGCYYKISGWMRTNSASATCTVKCSPSASTNWSTAQNLTPTASTTSSTWVAFSGVITATSTSMTLWLDGHTGGTGLNKAVCFDAITVECLTPTILNGSFEGGNTSGVGTSWTGYQRATNPTTVWTIQTASPPTGGGTQYQQIANTSATGGGGVRQNVTDCLSGETYTIAGWMRTNSSSATCTVKCSPTASTDWSTAANLSPAQTTTSSSWVAFSGTITATSTSMTLWLDGHTGGTGLNKAACFDAVTVDYAP